MSGKTIVSSTSRRNSVRRWCYQRFARNSLPERQIMMIMGAQRSGTTLFSRIFDDLYFADVFGEFSELSDQDPVGLRLNPPQDVMRQLEQSRANLVVMKPLVESQRAQFWLEQLPRSKIIWIYRHFSDAAASNVVKFGPEEGGRSHARAFVDEQFAQHDWARWKVENASEATRRLVASVYSEDMDPLAAAAAFWYSRNALYFEQGLQDNPDCILIRYEDLVRRPFLVIAYILDQFGIDELRSRSLSNIDTGSVGKGKALTLPSALDSGCRTLLQQLDSCYQDSPLGAMLTRL